MMPLSTRSKLSTLAVVAAFLLGGCGDYLSNRDRISVYTGDSTASNTAIQTIDPWPPSSYKTDLPSGG